METSEIRLRSVGRVKKSIKTTGTSNGGNERLGSQQDQNLEKKLQNGNAKQLLKCEEVGEDVAEKEFSAFTVSVELDLVSFALFTLAFCTRFYRLSTPRDIVFDELHYGRYVSMYLKNVFFFDQNPPLGKQLISAIVGIVGYEGNYTYTKIGEHLSPDFPIFWMRFLPAMCGSLLSPIVYKLLLEAKMNRWTALLGGLLIVFDNALLTQSRFILFESILILFSTLGLLFLLRFNKTSFGSPKWIAYGIASSTFFTLAFSVKYVGFMSFALGLFLVTKYVWDLLYDSRISDIQILMQAFGRWVLFILIPIFIYIGIFYIHLTILTKAGPHDHVMTSAFQASLEGGLSSITKGQPVKVTHGSQITLRHTYGRPCWLHSHAHLYPVKYADKRGSSHQQQVTCYSFKDVNNWWIVKNPEINSLVVNFDDPEPIKHGDVVQLVHGLTMRALNSHDVAAPVTPTCQEISCYIDYNISMKADILWRVEIANKETEGQEWNAINSHVRFIHIATKAALRFTGRQLPAWGFNQHEIAADKKIDQKDTIWNVEEHKYTKVDDKKERDRQLHLSEMIPTKQTKFSFTEKFIELQYKMLTFADQLTPEEHLFSSSPLEWPFMDKNIAYWLDNKTSGQIHLIGNLVLWYSGSIAMLVYFSLLMFYLLRRRRVIKDIPDIEWKRFQEAGEIFVGGYIANFVPYFFMDKTLFLHNYLPALLFKVLLLAFVIEHLDFLVSRFLTYSYAKIVFRVAVVCWLLLVAFVYFKFLAISYGFQKLAVDELLDLRWKDTWDFVVNKRFNVL